MAIFVLVVEDIPDAGVRLKEAGLEILTDQMVYGITI